MESLDLGFLGAQLGLVEDRKDLKHQLSLLYRLALLDQDLLKIPVLQSTHIDVPLRMDLADIGLSADHVLSDRTSDQDQVSVMGMVACWVGRSR